MPREKPAEYIQLPNTLKIRVGGGHSGIDSHAIARAAKALEDLKVHFSEWISSDVKALNDARNDFTEPADERALLDLHGRAMDLRSLGQLYEYPLVTRIAASLCRAIENLPARDLREQIIDSHVDAIRAIVQERAQNPNHPKGRVLTEELERTVAGRIADATHDGTLEGAGRFPR